MLVALAILLGSMASAACRPRPPFALAVGIPAQALVVAVRGIGAVVVAAKRWGAVRAAEARDVDSVEGEIREHATQRPRNEDVGETFAVGEVRSMGNSRG